MRHPLILGKSAAHASRSSTTFASIASVPDADETAGFVPIVRVAALLDQRSARFAAKTPRESPLDWLRFDMPILHRSCNLLTCLALFCSADVLAAQEVTYEERDGVRYQVTRQVVRHQVPTTVMQPRQQTTYVQQVTNQTNEYNQQYYVPVTQYETYYELRGRWNPFVTPYWEQVVEPVTVWQQQVGKVQLPTNQVNWVPQTQTVQVPVTEYRTAEQEIVTRVAVSGTPGQNVATAQPLPGSRAGGYPTAPTPAALPNYNTQPSATLAARPVNTPTGIGGIQLNSDPPQQPSAWQTPPDTSRYR
jgi:hypothetical protein